jgi:hypothetical protein
MDLFDKSFSADVDKFRALEEEAVAAGAVPILIECIDSFNKYHPGQSYIAARARSIHSPPNGSTPSDEFKRLKKDKTFCALNTEDMYDRNNALEQEYYHEQIPKLIRQRQILAYVLPPREKKTPAKKPKYEREYSRYDANGIFTVKYFRCPKAL